MNPTSEFHEFLTAEHSPTTANALRLLSADPSFWDAIRPSWLVDSEWRPRQGMFANWTSSDPSALPSPVLILHRAEQAPDQDSDERSYCVVLKHGGTATVPATELAPSPYVRWAVIRMHAVAKLATAGIDTKAVAWEDLSESLHQEDDPGGGPAPSQIPASDEREEHDEALSSPRN